jgi:hypothetical protein
MADVSADYERWASEVNRRYEAMKAEERQRCDHPLEAVKPNRNRQMECRLCGVRIGAQNDGQREAHDG